MSDQNSRPSLPSNPASSPKDITLRPPPSPQLHTAHRQSFAENLRGPASPRAHRQPSLSQQALQELLNNPPTGRHAQPEFAGRDWRTVRIGELTNPKDVRFVEMLTSVEAATNLLVASGPPNVVLIRDAPHSRAAIGTYDYDDLNAYLLLVVGLSKPDEEHFKSFNQLAQKGREGKPIPLKDVKDLGRKEPLIKLPETASLTQAVEVFGSGIHRLIVTKEGSDEVVGVLTQLRLLSFFYENRGGFAPIEPLYGNILKDLNIGSHTVIAINGDKPLTAALELMNNEGITSLPVLDNQHNVIGNISHVDVRLLTKSTSLPLLRSSCIHFISVILSERGVDDGKDSVPVFHVNPFSTLAHTIAKLVATRSHRMWVVESPSPSSSGPPTPVSTPAVLVPPSPYGASPPSAQPLSPGPAPSISASANLGATMSGRLIGVVSLTDILNLFAKASGLRPNDPNELRKHRRRSSSSSMRRSVDSSRSDSIAEIVGSGVGVPTSRRGSSSGGGPGSIRGKPIQ